MTTLYDLFMILCADYSLIDGHFCAFSVILAMNLDIEEEEEEDGPSSGESSSCETQRT